MTPIKLEPNDCIEVAIGEHTVRVCHVIEASDQHAVELRGVNCDLEGELPGLYYPKPRGEGEWPGALAAEDDTSHELNMDTIVELVKAEGFPAYVEQTGGGVATIYAGHTFKDTDSFGGIDVDVWPVVAGPGWFEGPGWTKPRADKRDFYIGPDDPDSSKEYANGEGKTEQQIADEIVRQVKARGAA